MKRNEIWKTNSMDYCNKRNEKNKEMKTYCETQTKNKFEILNSSKIFNYFLNEYCATYKKILIVFDIEI